MRQLTCQKAGLIEWHDVPAPRLEADSQALVRPLAVARCDIDRFLGLGLIASKQPFALGHECIAEIVALGDAVRSFEIGQRVLVSFQMSCGTCRACLARHSGNCAAFPEFAGYGMQPLSGTEYGGMLSEVVRVPFANCMLHAVREGLDAVTLASAADNVLDGYRAVAPHLAAQPGAEVLIVSHGYPSIPLYAAQAAIALGASRVDFVSGDAEQLALAERLGAHVQWSDFKDPERSYPIVVDAGVLATGVRYAIAATEPEGVCQSVSFFPARDVGLPFGRMYTRGIRLFIGRAHSSALLPELLPLLETRRLRPEEITSRVVGWRDAPKAFLEPAIKLVVQMTD